MSGIQTLFGFAILASMSYAQVIPISITCSGQAVSPTGSVGTCTTMPFGPMAIAVDLVGTNLTANFNFTFPNGATFSASQSEINANQLQNATLTGTAGIQAGTGTISWGSLIGAAGSVTYSLTIVRPSFTFSASGTLILPSFAGAGYPISGPGGSVLPSFCTVGATGCTTVGSGPGSFPIFEGSSGPGDGVLVLASPGSRLTFEGAASVLSFESSSESSSSGAMALAGLTILTPVQAGHAMYSAVVDCGAPRDIDCWISIPGGASGTIVANSRTAIPITVNPQAILATPGIYRASVAISMTPDAGLPTTLVVPVNVNISPAGPIPALSQTGLQFTAESGSTAAMTQLVLVSNSGSGSMAVTATASTLEGGNWLSVSPSTATAAPTQLFIQANPTGLAPGVYFGRVDVATQSIVVMFTISQAAGPAMSPAALTFIAPAKGNPAPQSILFSNPTSQPMTVSLGSYFEPSAAGWFGASVPAAATSTAAAPLVATVQVDVTGLAPGVYAGTLAFRVAETNRQYPVSIVLIVPQQGGASGTVQTAQSAVCTPARLLPVFSNLEPGFTTAAGTPVPVLVSVADDCGTTLASDGSVMVFFPGSAQQDAPLALAPLGNGLWSGTWMSHNLKGGTAAVSVVASSSSAPSLYGSAGVSGTLTANGAIPVIASGGAVWTPGTRGILISGSNLAAGSVTATPPLLTTLGGTAVLLGRQPLLIQSVSPTRISALLPDNAGVPLAVVVQRNGSTYSMPEPVTPLAPVKRRTPRGVQEDSPH